MEVLKNLGSNDTYKILSVVFLHINNPGQNLWQKVKKSTKTVQGKKFLISAFAQVFTGITKNLYLEGRLSTRL